MGVESLHLTHHTSDSVFNKISFKLYVCSRGDGSVVWGDTDTPKYIGWGHRSTQHAYLLHLVIEFHILIDLDFKLHLKTKYIQFQYFAKKLSKVERL